MKSIKNAIVYKAELPQAKALEQHLAESKFVEAGSLDWKAAGFVPIKETGELVSTFEGGLAFAVRYDTRILPASVIRMETDKRIQRIEEQELRRVGRKESLLVRDEVIGELLPKALMKTAIVTCFYDQARQYLIVPVSSKQLADVATSLLIHAVGSVKTTTINVSDVKLGLTTKLQQWLEHAEGEPFGSDFTPAGRAKLVLTGEERKQSVAIDMSDLENARAAILDAIVKGFKVAELGMAFQSKTGLRLTADFQLRGLSFEYEPADVEDMHELWQHKACIQVLEVGHIIDGLCDLLGYREPAKEQEAAA